MPEGVSLGKLVDKIMSYGLTVFWDVSLGKLVEQIICHMVEVAQLVSW